MSDQKQRQLAYHEAIVERSFAEAGEALAVIRDERLFGQPTFAAYCRERWGFTESYAGRLIRAAGVASALSAPDKDLPPGTDEAGGKSGPVSERQARALSRLPEVADQARALELARAEAGGEPTAAQVEAAVGEVELGKLRAAQASVAAELPDDAEGQLATIRAAEARVLERDQQRRAARREDVFTGRVKSCRAKLAQLQRATEGFGDAADPGLAFLDGYAAWLATMGDGGAAAA